MTQNPTALYDAVAEVLDVVAEAINAVLPDDLRHERVTVVNGPPAIDGWEDCTEHLVAWAEVAGATLNFPDPAGRLVVCQVPAQALQIVVQSVRCEPTIGDDGTFPPAEDLDAAARLLYLEGRLAWDALVCWAMDEENDRDVVMVSSQPTPPQGAVAGWETRITVEVDGCDPCAETNADAVAAFLGYS